MTSEISLRSQAHGMAAYMSKGNPEYRSLCDKDEYVELDTEPEPAVEEPEIQRDIFVGDIVRHFKREWFLLKHPNIYIKYYAFAQHTETGEKLVIYQALYSPFKVCARPYTMVYERSLTEKNIRISNSSTGLRKCSVKSMASERTDELYRLLLR